MRSKLDLFHDAEAARSSGASSTTVGSRAAGDFLNSAEFAFNEATQLPFFSAVYRTPEKILSYRQVMRGMNNHRRIAGFFPYLPMKSS